MSSAASKSKIIDLGKHIKTKAFSVVPSLREIQPFGTPCKIAGTERQLISRVRAGYDPGAITFATANDVYRLGRYSPTTEPGTMVSRFIGTNQSPLGLISILLDCEHGEFRGFEAKAIMTAEGIPFSPAQVWHMLLGESRGAKSLLRNGNSNIFPIQVGVNQVAMLYAWLERENWKVRVSTLGMGRGTAPGVVIHARNERKKKNR